MRTVTPTTTTPDETWPVHRRHDLTRLRCDLTTPRAKRIHRRRVRRAVRAALAMGLEI